EAADVLAAFRSFPPGKQNFTIRRIDEAARPATRARRIDEAVAEARQRQQGAE
ncbi:MAG: YdeI/OmpD-associated family protein, partial [Ideonella sp.]|nr:YdeI/OmpD-associated family protein [Ideonella sp.]